MRCYEQLDMFDRRADRWRVHRDGYRDGVELTVDRVRALGHEARNTYTITKDELERIQAEMVG